MNSKALLAVTLLLTALLLFAPTVYSCVNFSGYYTGDQGHGQGEWLTGTLWDNFGGSTNVKVCWNDGPASDGLNDGVYRFSCMADNYAAIFNVSTTDYVVQYANPGGNFQFYVPYENLAWNGCVFGCEGSQCFVT